MHVGGGEADAADEAIAHHVEGGGREGGESRSPAATSSKSGGQHDARRRSRSARLPATGAMSAMTTSATDCPDPMKVFDQPRRAGPLVGHDRDDLACRHDDREDREA